MFTPLAESAVTVDGGVINAAGAIITVGGLALTAVWLRSLYRD